MKKSYVVGIVGGSASGKSTLCSKLAEKLAGEQVKQIHMDDYFRPEAQRPFSEAPVTGTFYMDDNHPQTMDLEKLHMDLKQEIAGGRYSVIIVEGLLTLWDKAIYSLLDLKIFTDCRADERIVRRLRRNMEWGQSFDEIANVCLDMVRYRHDEFVEPSKWKADLIFNGSRPSEKALQMLSGYIRGLQCAGSTETD